MNNLQDNTALSEAQDWHPKSWTRVSAARRQIESLFLATGNNLVLMNDALGGLSGPISALSELHEDRLGAMVTRMRQTAAACGELAAIMGATMADVEAITQRTRLIGQQLRILSRTVRMMKIVGLNAKVAASALADRHAGLEVFTSATGTLIENAETTLRDSDQNMEGILTLLRELLDEGLTKGRGELGDFSRKLLYLADMIDRSRQNQGNSPAFGAALGQHLEVLKGALGQALVALQVGDSTRQRFEHAEEIGALAKAEHSDAGTLLAWRQFEAALADFCAGTAQGSQALHLAQQEGQAISGGGSAALGGGVGLDDIRTTVMAITVRMGEIHDLSTMMGQQITELSQQFGRLEAVLRSIGSLEEQMRIVGVNAVIACARLGGDGLALKEIANQLGSLSSENANCFIGIHDALTQVEDRISALVDAMSERPAQMMHAIVAENADLVPWIDDIFAARTDLMAAMGQVLVQVSGGLPRAIEGIAALVRELRAIDAAQHAEEPGPARDLSEPLCAAIVAIYSTAAERRVHESFCREFCLQGSGLAEAHAPPPEEAQDLDSILF